MIVRTSPAYLQEDEFFNTYNAANQLLSSTPPTGSATNNSYDNNGNLILQNTGGVLTTFT
jgi:YD repeat-containing protein